jgi:hypothetical protein
MALCECGCGQDAGVYAKTKRTKGYIQGQPKRFIHGHASKLARSKKICVNGHPRTVNNVAPSNRGCKECAKEHNSKNNKLRKYNLTEERYKSMLVEQQNKCAICKVLFSDDPNTGLYPCIDHVHNSLKTVRGLLCRTCNQGLGLFYESIDALLGAVQYLNKFKEIQKCQSSMLSELRATAHLLMGLENPSGLELRCSAMVAGV